MAEDDEPVVTDEALTGLLRQLSVESYRFAELFGEIHRLHRTDLNALAVVLDADRAGEPMSPGRLAAALHLSPSATTAAVDRLEAAGHLVRRRDPADRRKVELAMSPKARLVGRAFFAPLAEAYAGAWREFDPGERTAIARFLTASIAATVRVRGGLHED